MTLESWILPDSLSLPAAASCSSRCYPFAVSCCGSLCAKILTKQRYLKPMSAAARRKSSKRKDCARLRHGLPTVKLDVPKRAFLTYMLSELRALRADAISQRNSAVSPIDRQRLEQ